MTAIPTAIVIISVKLFVVMLPKAKVWMLVPELQFVPSLQNWIVCPGLWRAFAVDEAMKIANIMTVIGNPIRNLSSPISSLPTSHGKDEQQVDHSDEKEAIDWEDSGGGSRYRPDSETGQKTDGSPHGCSKDSGGKEEEENQKNPVAWVASEKARVDRLDRTGDGYRLGGSYSPLYCGEGKCLL